MNKSWHKEYKIPAKPTLDQEIQWHTDHQNNCGCTGIPKNLQKYIWEVFYEYTRPKTKEEKEEQERRVHKAYEVLFEATLNSDEWKQYVASKKSNGK